MLKLGVSTLAAVSLISTCLAFGAPPEGGKKIPPKSEATKIETFTWSNPFSSTKIRKFEAACEAATTFKASEYMLHDLFLEEPAGLAPYGDALKTFFSGREYPGGWDGWDEHGYERTILKMEYADVPIKVREWIEDQERNDGAGKGLYAIYDKSVENAAVKHQAKLPKTKERSTTLRPLDQKRVLIFAPGALYDILPLWVVDKSGCPDVLNDLTNYSSQLIDGKVVAWPSKHTKVDRGEGGGSMEFTIQAQQLKSGISRSEDEL